MTRDQLVQHLRYTAWASQKLIDAVRALDPAEQSRDFGCSHNSILETLAHVYLADCVWLSRLSGNSRRSLSDPADDLSVQGLARDWPPLLERLIASVEVLDDAGVTRVVDYMTLDGTAMRTPVWQILLHVVNHGTLHRGQVVGMIRQLGHKPPATDLIYYYRSH
jgi:uncharacterized damage-inducible protein DinB